MLTEDLAPSSTELSEDCLSYDETLRNWASAVRHSAGTMACQNGGNRSPNDTALHPNRQDSLSTALHEPHILHTVLCYPLCYVPILSHICLLGPSHCVIKQSDSRLLPSNNTFIKIQ